LQKLCSLFSPTMQMQLLIAVIWIYCNMHYVRSSAHMYVI